MLALSCLSVGLVPHAAVRTQPLVQAQPPLRVARRAPPPQAHAAAIYESSQMATTVQLGLDPTVISDTLLDLGVYGLLALTVGLTLYSIYVTLDESNKKARRQRGHSRPQASRPHVRGTRTSLLRAVRTGGAGQPASGDHARSDAEPVPASGVLSHTTNRRGYPYPYPSPLPGGQAGGWTNPNPDGALVKEDDPAGLRKNMVYNPVRYG